MRQFELELLWPDIEAIYKDRLVRLQIQGTCTEMAIKRLAEISAVMHAGYDYRLTATFNPDEVDA